MRGAVLAAVAMAAMAGACGPAGAAPPSPQGITAFAAASLREPIERLAEAWQEARPGAHVAVSTGSSTALRVQIEQGAPADVFLAADTTNPDTLAAAGLTAGPPVPFATNRLAIVVPRDNPATIASAEDLGRPGVRVVAAGDGVPITAYASTLVERLGIAAAYERNVVSREDDVRAVLAKIALGEGDAAIVYATDARATEDARTVPIGADVDVRATYAAAVIGTDRDPARARQFFDWLTGPKAQAILGDLGFLPPP